MNMSKPVSIGLILALTTLSASGAEYAKVNGTLIDDRDLETALNSIPEGQRATLLEDPLTKRQLVDEVINQTVLYQQAKKDGMESSAEFKDAVEMFQKQTLASLAVKKLVLPKLGAQAIRKFYDDNKWLFSTEQVRAQHILSDSEEKARAILVEAKKTENDFQVLAEKSSIDPSAKQNRGDLGFFARDSFDPAFTKAAFDTKRGEVVGPIKTAFGYHVIKVIEKKPGKPLEFSEVELKAKNLLQQKILKDVVAELRAKAKIEIVR